MLWNEVQTTFDGEEVTVQVPVTEETVENYGLFGEAGEAGEAGDVGRDSAGGSQGGARGDIQVVDEDDPDTLRGWRATELIHDYVTLQDGQRYGWV